jgi:hypothetical protein
MAKNVTVTPADGDIQFENTSGTAAGRIEQNGDDLVISNAVGDVLFGDADSDVYIGDGVNSVDLLFEQSSSIKAEDGSTGVTLTLGSSDTTLSLYAPQLTTTMTIGASGSIDYTPDTGTVLSFDSQSIIRRLNANGGVSIGHDDQVIIAGGDTSSVMDSNVSGEVVAIGAEGGLLVYGFPNNNTSWSNRVQFSFGNNGKMSFGTASDTNIYRSAANTLKTDDSFVVGDKLYITTLDANTSSTTALVMNGTEVEKRTLGSNAFNSTAYSTFDGAYSSLSGVPSTFAPSSHNHDGRYYTETESDQRFPRGRTISYAAAEDNGSDAWYKIFQVTDAGSSPVECHIRGYAHTSLSFVVSEGYQGGHAHINILDALSSSTNNGYKFIEGVRVASNGDVEILLNGGSNTSIEMTIIGDATPVSALVVSTTEAVNIKDSVTTLSNGMMRTYGKLYIGDADASTTATTALFLNGEEVESRSLGSNAFNSTSYLPLAGGTMTGNIILGANKIAADTTAPTAHIQVGAGTSNTGNRSDIALLGGSNAGGVINALGLVNTAAGANSNGVALNFHNGNSWSPTGQIVVKQNSSGTSTDSGMYFYTYDGGLNNRMTIKNDGNIRLHAYGAGLLQTDANGNVSVDTSSYLTSIGSNSVGITELNVADGSNGQVLTTDGNGSLSFTTVTSGSSYTLPAATDSALGGVKLGYTEANKNYAVQLDSNSKAFVNVPWSDTNTNTTYSAGTGLNLSGTTFSVDEFAEDKHIYTKNEHGTANKGIFMPMVKGGFYATSTSTITGRLKVVLPSYKTNMMVSFKLDIYEYNTDRTVSYQISGYNNNDSNATWYNTSVVCLSDSDNRNLTVRFLRDLDAGEQYIGIGETDTTWSYPQVIVRDFMGGYNTQIQKASGSWAVGFVQDDPGVVVNTHSNNTPIVLTSRLSGTISTSQLADNSVNAAKLNVSGNGTSGQVLTSDGDGTFSWTAKTTNTNTVTSVGTSGNEATGTVTIAGSGATSVSQSGNTITISSTDNNTTYSAATTSADGLMSSTDKTKLDGIAAGANAYVHPTGAGNKHIPTGGAAGQFLKYSSSGTAVWATPSYTTNTDTTYSAGSGLDLTSTTFSVEADLRDGITHVGVDTKNYITFDPTNGRIDFYAGNVFVARLESDGDLHVKGDVIAFSSIFS